MGTFARNGLNDLILKRIPLIFKKKMTIRETLIMKLSKKATLNVTLSFTDLVFNLLEFGFLSNYNAFTCSDLLPRVLLNL